MLGALRSAGKIWPSGRSALHDVQPFADLVFATTTDDGSGRNIHALGSGENTTSFLPENGIPETLTGAQYIERNIAPPLQDSLLDVNWFDFFQPADP